MLGLLILISLIFLFTEVQAQEDIESGRIIVKYKATTDKEPGIYLRQDAPLQPITGAASIDSVNQSINLLSATPLFRKTYVEDLRESQDVFLKEMDAVKSRFQKRTLRIPWDAKIPDVGNIYLLEVPKDTDLKAAVASLSQNPFVEYAELSEPVHFDWVPHDPYYKNPDGTWHTGSWGNSYPDLWGLKSIQVEEAWQTSKGNGVVIAVVDTGVDYLHRDFNRTANGWVNENERKGDNANCSDGQDDDGNDLPDDCYGWDFFNHDPDPMDGIGFPTNAEGHGTHVTGIMAAAADNRDQYGNYIGIPGIAHESKFMILKIYNTDEKASAIRYAVDEGADVINCSWETTQSPPPSVIADALYYANAAGVAVIASAGNYHTTITTNNLPASHAGALTVGASTPPVYFQDEWRDRKANFSNYGNFLDLIAPGGGDDSGYGDAYPHPFVPADDPRHNILSLKASHSVYDTDLDGSGPLPPLVIGTDLYRMGGTSQAAPHVTGVAALIMAVESNNLQLDNIYDVLRATADDTDIYDTGQYGKGVDDQTGFGRLNAYKAVTARCLRPFTDVPSGYWAKDEIRRIACRGITTGCNSDQFCPTSALTEAAAATFVIRAKYTDNFDYDTNPHFNDVPPTHPFFKYIQKMYDDNINRAGCGNNMYCSGNPVTRAKAAEYIIRANYAIYFALMTL